MASSLEVFCGRSLNNYTIWQHNSYGYCYEQLVFVFSSHFVLALVSTVYICLDHINNTPTTSPNLKRATVLHVRLAIAVSSALMPVLSFMLKQFTANIGPARVNCLVDIASSIAWLLLSLYLWKLRRQAIDLVRTHTPIILAWTLTLLSQCVRQSTVVKQLQNDDTTLPIWEAATVITSTVLQALYLLTLLPGPRHTTEYHEYDQSSAYYKATEGREMLLLSSAGKLSGTTPLGVAEDNASLLSLVTFWWIQAIMRKGAKGQLKNANDVFCLPKTLTASYVETYFSSVYPQGTAAFAEEVFISHKPSKIIPCDNKEHSSGNGYGSTRAGSVKQEGDTGSQKRIVDEEQESRITVLRALFKAFGVRFLLMGIVKLLASVFTFAGPMLLHSLVRFMEHRNEPMTNGYLYAFGLLLSTCLLAVIGTHYGYQVSKIQIQVRAALVTTVYRKSLAVSATGLSTFTTGQILNFMSVDTRRVVRALPNLHAFWNLPFIVAGAMYLLYRQVGIACLSGLGYALLLMPLTRLVMGKIVKYHKRMMKRKDGRVKLMNEILNGIRVIKFYAWERHFKKQIEELRSKELKNLKGIKYLGAFNIYVWATTPMVISLFIFTTYALMGHELTAAKVFTSLALVNILRQPLNSFTRVVNNLVEAWVSINRLQHFMDLEDSDLASYYRQGDNLPDGDVLSIQQGTFYWGNPKQKKGGKGGMKRAQTTKDGKEGTRADYTRLEPVGDEEKRQEAVMLDDIYLNVSKGQLVGVIGKVGSGKSSLFSAILADMDKKKGSISVAGLGEEFGLATQEPWIQHATVKENILFGREYNAKRYVRVIEACALIPDLKILPAGDNTEVGEKGITLSGGQKARVALARAVYQETEIYLLDDPLAAVDADVGQHIFSKCIMGLLANKTRILCTHHTRFLAEADLVVVMDGFRIVDKGPPSVVFNHPQYASHMNYSKLDSKAEEETSETGVKAEGATEEKLVEDEKKEEGALKLSVYKSYGKALGIALASLVLASFVFMQLVKNLSDLWLSHWVSNTSPTLPINEAIPSQPFNRSLDLQTQEYWSSDSENSTSSRSFVVYHLGVYGGLVLINSVLTLFRSFLFAYGGLRAAKAIHEGLLNSILKAPIYFFDKTPVGRIFNRFSSDILIIDVGLTRVMNNMITQGISVIGTVIVTCYSLPWFTICLIPMAMMYYYVQDYYRKTSRELRRITSISNSAIYSHFGESLAGLAVIKGMRATKRFRLENRARLELYQRAMFSSNTVSYWLSFRLQMIGVAMVTAVAVIAVLEHQYQNIDPGLVGLAITYALSITNMLMPFINTLAESEKNMVSVERTHHYTVAIPHEPQYGLIKPPHFWPLLGVVKFYNVQFRYRDDHPKALSGVNFETRPGEKVGIVGRTGAGKSTLFLVLFRMVQIQQGSVRIDGINLADLSLEDVRSRLAIIPQDPFLFSGSVRRNLDPVGQFSDSELWCVLEKCHIKDVVTRMGGLEASAGEGGKQFSTGQKQLICLARAMLTKAKVLCIDEATASVDMATDDLLQQAIKEEFQDNTILTIAHRLNTLRDSDRILVMDGGKVTKFEKTDVTLVNM